MVENEHKKNWLDVLLGHYKRLTFHDWETLNWSGRLTALLLPMLIGAGLIFIGTKIEGFASNKPNLAAIADTVTSELATEERIISIGGNDANPFEGLGWLLSSTSAAKENDGFILLLSDSVRLELDGEMRTPESYPLQFIPKGIHAINLEISKRNLYRIIIGEGDYKTIRLYARDLKTEKWFQVFTNDGNVARLNKCIFEPGDLVQTEVTETYSDIEKALTLNLKVFCEGEKDTFDYTFKAPVNLFSITDFYIGLTDPDGTNLTSIYFVQPVIDGNIR